MTKLPLAALVFNVNANDVRLAVRHGMADVQMKAAGVTRIALPWIDDTTQITVDPNHPALSGKTPDEIGEYLADLLCKKE